MSANLRLPLVRPGEQAQAEISAVLAQLSDAHAEHIVGSLAATELGARHTVAV